MLDEHPFWVDGTEDFLPAGDLHPGDSFHGPTGEKTTLVSTRAEDHPEGVVVYNFEVEGSHTYFVLTQSEDGLTGAGVLVHNAKGRKCGGGGKKPPNPDGQHGKADHRSTVRKIVEKVKKLFPNHKIREGKSIRDKTGVNRRPDVSVEDPETGEIIKVFEAARKNQDGTFVSRERAKMREYDEAGIPNEFVGVK